MPTVTVTLIGKPGCHLCDDARAITTTVLADFPSVRMRERSVLDDPELHARYWDEIPVVLINETVHTIYRVDAERLRVAIAHAATEEGH